MKLRPAKLQTLDEAIAKLMAGHVFYDPNDKHPIRYTNQADKPFIVGETESLDWSGFANWLEEDDNPSDIHAHTGWIHFFFDRRSRRKLECPCGKGEGCTNPLFRLKSFDGQNDYLNLNPKILADFADLSTKDFSVDAFFCAPNESASEVENFKQEAPNQATPKPDYPLVELDGDYYTYSGHPVELIMRGNFIDKNYPSPNPRILGLIHHPDGSVEACLWDIYGFDGAPAEFSLYNLVKEEEAFLEDDLVLVSNDGFAYYPRYFAKWGPTGASKTFPQGTTSKTYESINGVLETWKIVKRHPDSAGPI